MNSHSEDKEAVASSVKKERAPKYIDISGMVFGKLTVIRRAVGAPSNQRATRWLCRCDCGKEKIIRGTSIRFGTSRSCGCESLSSLEIGWHMTTHGMSDTWQARILYGIIQRCTDQNCEAYPYYGGRGITFDPRWAHDKSNFFKDIESLGERPAGYSLDRIDTNGNYITGNIRWASQTTQSRNRRNNINLTFNGETKCVAEWALERNMDKRTLWYRVKKMGWSTERALTEPVITGERKQIEHKEYNKPAPLAVSEDW